MSIQDDHTRPAIAMGKDKHSPQLSLKGLAPGQWRELQGMERQQIETVLKN
jgi:16S rRNA U516 pseudouridylate synthase RsuA-like enzyme